MSSCLLVNSYILYNGYTEINLTALCGCSAIAEFLLLNYILYNVDCQGIRLQQVKHRRHHAHLIQENCTCRHKHLR